MCSVIPLLSQIHPLDNWVCPTCLWAALRAMDRNDYLESCMHAVQGRGPDPEGAAADAAEERAAVAGLPVP